MELTMAVDEPGGPCACDEDGPLPATKGAEAGAEGVGGEPDAREGEGHLKQGVVAVGQLGGGERQPHPHPLFALDAKPGGQPGAGDGCQHIGVGEGDAELQVGARGAPLSQHSAPLVPNAGAGVSPPAIDPDPELNHDEPPAHSAS
ncbi:hypothetical protein D3C80_1208550 [compost metagenome]